MEHNRNNAITMLWRLLSISFGIVLILSLVPSQALGQTHEGLLGNANELLQRLVSNVSLDDRTDSPHNSIIDVFLLGLTGASNRSANVASSDSSPNDMQVQDEYTGGIRVIYRNTGGGGDSEEFDAQRPKINFVIYGPSGTVVASKLLSDFDYNPGKTPPTWIVDNLAPGTYTIEEQNYDLNNYKGDIVFSKNATKLNENSATIVVGEYYEDVVCVNSYFERDGSGGIRLNRIEQYSNGDPVEGTIPTKGVSYIITGPNYYINELSIYDFQRIVGVDEFQLINDLEPGTYTIYEVYQGTSDYSVSTSYTGVDSVIQNIATFSVKSGEISNIVVTDTYTPAITGTMDITKMVDGIILTTDDEYRITFKVYDNLGNVHSYPLSSFTKLSINASGSIKTAYLISIDGLIPGEYTIVEENANKDGYTLKSEFTIDQITGDETNNKVNVSPGQKASVRVTNTYIQGTAADNGSLRLEKYVSGADLSDADKENMRFVVVGPEGAFPSTKTYRLREFSEDLDGVHEHSFSLVVDDLTPGVYTITEEGADLAGYTRDTYPVGDIENVSSTEVKVVIGYAKQSVAHFNNYYSENGPVPTYTGGIKLTKVVSGVELNDTEKNQTTFTIVGPQETTPVPRRVRYDQFVSGSFTIGNLEPGTYEITEEYVDKDGFGLEIAFEGATPLPTKGKATVQIGDTISDVIITNTYTSNAQQGSIAITKRVSGKLNLSDLTTSDKNNRVICTLGR